MYVDKHIGILRLIRKTWRTLVLILVVVTVLTAAHLEMLNPHVNIPVSVVTPLLTALSFFIAFFTAQAYDRWWEARKIWGTIVNDSRSFARMVLTFLGSSDGQISDLRRRLIRRHIAHLYAVKAKLRQEDTQDCVAYLSDDDAERVNGSSNIGYALLQLQGRDLNAAEREGHIDVIRMALLNDMLSRFSTSMGMAERIKLTVFPAYYAAMIRVSIWVGLVVFAVTLSDQVGYWAIPFAALMGALFTVVHQLAQSLLDPFEGAQSDTPMSAIVRTIEINLLEQLGEEQVPAPIEPVDGQYLM